MDWEALHNVVRSRFKTQIADVQSVTVQYDNAPFTEPEDATWVRWTIVPAQTSLVAIGGTSRRYRTVGLAVASIFVPVESGDALALRLADAVATAFRCVTDTGVVFSSPSVINRGRDENWWQVNVECPFYADDLA